jgi:hypothetical protein
MRPQIRTFNHRRTWLYKIKDWVAPFISRYVKGVQTFLSPCGDKIKTFIRASQYSAYQNLLTSIVLQVGQHIASGQHVVLRRLRGTSQCQKESKQNESDHNQCYSDLGARNPIKQFLMTLYEFSVLAPGASSG